MITLLPVLVLIGVFGALPVFAIPSPDFLGPVIATAVAMLGLASAFFGAAVLWMKRALRKFTSGDRRLVWVILGCSFLVILLVIAGISYVRYQNSKEEFVAQVAEHKLQMQIDDLTASSSPTVVTSAPALIPAPTSTPPVQTLSTDLLSSRVSSTTVLIPVETLRQVVEQQEWSDRTLLVDIREAEEREVGQIDATTTWLRYGDLIHGGSAQLPHDKDILVICWTSIRGEEIATWLRNHGFARAYAILGGLQGDTDPKVTGWIDAGLPWRGHTKWSDVFGKSFTMSVQEAKKKFDAKATVIDITSASHYAAGHIPGSLRLDFESAPTSEVDRVMGLVPEKADLLIVCNGYVNCFYAKILGIRLSRLGRSFVEPYDDNNYDWKKAGYPLVK